MADDEKLLQALRDASDELLQQIMDAQNLDDVRASLEGELAGAAELNVLQTLASQVQDVRASAPTIMGMAPVEED